MGLNEDLKEFFKKESKQYSIKFNYTGSVFLLKTRLAKYDRDDSIALAHAILDCRANTLDRKDTNNVFYLNGKDTACLVKAKMVKSDVLIRKEASSTGCIRNAELGDILEYKIFSSVFL